MSDTEDCKCGGTLYRIVGLRYDRDGMRDARFCEDCKTVFSTHAHGFEKHLVLKDSMESRQRERVIGLLRQALHDVEEG